MEKGLSYFIQRAVILHQYRHLLRASSALRRRDVTMAADVRQRVHAAFRDEVADPLLVKKMISDGAKQLTLLESLAGIESSSAAGSKGKARGGREAVMSPSERRHSKQLEAGMSMSLAPEVSGCV